MARLLMDEVSPKLHSMYAQWFRHNFTLDLLHLHSPSVMTLLQVCPHPFEQHLKSVPCVCWQVSHSSLHSSTHIPGPPRAGPAGGQYPGAEERNRICNMNFIKSHFQGFI